MKKIFIIFMLFLSIKANAQTNNGSIGAKPISDSNFIKLTNTKLDSINKILNDSINVYVLNPSSGGNPTTQDTSANAILRNILTKPCCTDTSNAYLLNKIVFYDSILSKKCDTIYSLNSGGGTTTVDSTTASRKLFWVANQYSVNAIDSSKYRKVFSIDNFPAIQNVNIDSNQTRSSMYLLNDSLRIFTNYTTENFSSCGGGIAIPSTFIGMDFDITMNLGTGYDATNSWLFAEQNPWNDLNFPNGAGTTEIPVLFNNTSAIQSFINNYIIPTYNAGASTTLVANDIVWVVNADNTVTLWYNPIVDPNNIVIVAGVNNTNASNKFTASVPTAHTAPVGNSYIDSFQFKIKVVNALNINHICDTVNVNEKTNCTGSNETFWINGTNKVVFNPGEICSYHLIVEEGEVQLIENGQTAPYTYTVGKDEGISSKNRLLNMVEFDGATPNAKATIKIIR